MNEAVRRSRTRIVELEQRMAGIDKLVAAIPMTSSQIGELNRDAEMLKVKVGQLISKKAEAEITADLELKSGPTEFRVLESAQPDTLAASPNRPQLLIFAVLAALALGCAIALGQELSDRSLRSDSEADTAVALPVLACVPRLAVVGVPRQLSVQSENEG
jgi:uncharacterized protein involved in exopolysaccharide biosynthesis